MGVVIQLFGEQAKPSTMDSEFWEWGQEHSDDWVNNVDLIVESIKTATTEHELLAAIRELKTEVDEVPGLTEDAPSHV